MEQIPTAMLTEPYINKIGLQHDSKKLLAATSHISKSSIHDEILKLMRHLHIPRPSAQPGSDTFLWEWKGSGRLKVIFLLCWKALS